MLNQYGKKQRWLFIIALVLADGLLMSDFIFSPTVDALYKLFPNNLGAVNYIVSGSAVITFIVSPLTSRLCSRCDVKKVLLVGGGIGILGDVLLIFTVNPLLLCILRTMNYVGYTTVTICVFTIVNNLYDDEEKTTAMTGYMTAGMAGIGTLVGIIAGNMATTGFRNAYKVYYAFIGIMLFIALWMPPIRLTEKENEKETKNNGKKEKCSARFWIVIAGVLVFNVVYTLIMRFVSVYTAENTLGNEALTGYLNSASLVVGVVLSLLFGKIFSRVGRKLLWIAYLLAVLGVLIMWIRPSLVTAIAGMILIGAMYPLCYSYSMSVIPTMVPESRKTEVLSYITIIETLASLGCAYGMTGVKTLLHTDSYTGTLWVYALLLVVFAIATAISIDLKTGRFCPRR